MSCWRGSLCCFGSSLSGGSDDDDGNGRGQQHMGKAGECAQQVAPHEDNTLQAQRQVDQYPFHSKPQASASISRYSTEETSARASSTSSSDCISVEHCSSDFNSVHGKQYISQIDCLSQLLGVQEQIKGKGDLQVRYAKAGWRQT